jgi:peptidyl-prolyl cis-trans isomerase A (cyclophilin A)
MLGDPDVGYGDHAMITRVLGLLGAGALLLTSCGSERGERETARRGSATTAMEAPPSEAPPPAPPAPEPAEEAVAQPSELDPRLLQPAEATETAPAEYTVELDTTKGPILVDVRREWAPQGADRFYNLVNIGYFTDVAFFRVVQEFMAQGGIHGDPRVNRAWRMARIPDDPVRESNRRGMVTFATSGQNSRTTQFFINLVDNTNLDDMGFSPFGRVQPDSLAVLDQLYSGYGDGPPRGRGPMQARIQGEGNSYLRASFTELDYIRSARIVE